MKKTPIDALIVVEGKTDADFIGSFLECDICTTNGSAVSCETLTYIKEASKKRKVIVLTDPDYPGRQIRKKIEEAVPEVYHAFVPKEVSIKHGKVGVAESEKDAVLEAILKLVPSKSPAKPALNFSDLVDLGLAGASDSALKREVVGRKLGVGHNNAKTLLKRLNALGLTRKDVEDALK